MRRPDLVETSYCLERNKTPRSGKTAQRDVITTIVSETTRNFANELIDHLPTTRSWCGSSPPATRWNP